MTGSLISLMSIFIGIIGAHFMGFIYKKYSFGFIGNSIAGVFGGILFIKSFEHLGFSPYDIMQSEGTNLKLLFIHFFVSLSGGAIGLLIAKKLRNKMNKK